MKRALIAASVAVVARAGAVTTPAIPLPAQNALTAVDIVPTQLQITAAFVPYDPVTELIAIEQNTNMSPTITMPMRLRAIHALSPYCSAPCADQDPAHVALRQIIDAQPTPQSGADLLLLRAAIESIGPMRDTNDLDTLAAFLNHNSRDIRATAALALGDLCNTNAAVPLRARTQYETVDQVKLAISSALRALSSCQ